MKSAGWYFMKGGQKVWAATMVEIRKLAQLAADSAGRPVTVRKLKVRRNPSSTSTRTEVRSPTRTATSTKADTRGNVTVTGGAGDGATTVNLGARRTRRNPAIRGVDFTGEEWTVAGMGRRGRLAVTEGSRADAERMADYLYGEGYRALTIRRTKAPQSKPTKGAQRPTIDVRPPAVGRRRRRA